MPGKVITPPNQEKVIAGTGHRPDKLFRRGYRSMDAELPGLIKLMEIVIRKHGATHVISGGAQGLDTALAQAALNLGVKLTLALPYRKFGDNWPLRAQMYRDRIIEQATEVVYVDEVPEYMVVATPGYHVAKLQKRNEWMTDHCDEMVSTWDGSTGGTFNNIQYAKRVGKLVSNYWDVWKASDAGLKFQTIS